MNSVLCHCKIPSRLFIIFVTFFFPRFSERLYRPRQMQVSDESVRFPCSPNFHTLSNTLLSAIWLYCFKGLKGCKYLAMSGRERKKQNDSFLQSTPSVIYCNEMPAIDINSILSFPFNLLEPEFYI